jgi:hypothetical protein
MVHQVLFKITHREPRILQAVIGASYFDLKHSLRLKLALSLVNLRVELAQGELEGVV